MSGVVGWLLVVGVTAAFGAVFWVGERLIGRDGREEIEQM
ncbi:hypothetical protein Aab01nite_22930 [Paractinoplanes abujensis]|uniref:Uncharacterized protein n=1 Tax=Paractinoplanes abujensis TaxID=882441 RepID=A0A7W7D158_9ACTN|nr:hypothetical protein [Actinoplanes abujensis]GID18703.1 hypothetical protein Aab01nite_22930 [Actinoplanes abujensis]